jgi:UDP-N-acetylmuramate--alanine ligase
VGEVVDVHLIGIGGSGLSAIARLLLESGFSVSGSDRHASPVLESLAKAGAQIFVGHYPENVAGVSLVVRSSAIPDDNVEVQTALAANIPVLKRADFLGSLMDGRTGIAVAGTHGKTTTTAMIAWMLSSLGQDPSYIIGSDSRNLGTNARAGKGPTFVVEADEYDRMFLGLKPKIAVITNVEYDHPDFYLAEEDYFQAFSEFASTLEEDGVLLVCGDDSGAARLLKEAGSHGIKAIPYGICDRTYDYYAHQMAHNPVGGLTFDVILRGRSSDPIRITLQVPGEHNVRNCLAAMAVADQLGMPVNEAARALSAFKGTGRRFEVLGEANGITVIDDYAHHPTEIRATLSAARARFPGRQLWVVWQPHTYSRTRSLFKDFASAFIEANHVVVTEVYAAREPVAPDFSALQVVQAMGHPDAYFIPDLTQTTAFLLTHLDQGDVLLVLSAGDADQVSAQVLAALKERSNKDD